MLKFSFESLPGTFRCVRRAAGESALRLGEPSAVGGYCMGTSDIRPGYDSFSAAGLRNPGHALLHPLGHFMGGWRVVIVAAWSSDVTVPLPRRRQTPGHKSGSETYRQLDVKILRDKKSKSPGA